MILTENKGSDLEQDFETDFDLNLTGSDWRTYRSYSEDLYLDDADTLVFCLSPLDNKKGYAVYDSANGARMGTLLWEEKKEADWQARILLKDFDNDGIKEIGISMTDGKICWYRYQEDLEGTWPDNKNGCFERID